MIGVEKITNAFLFQWKASSDIWPDLLLVLRLSFMVLNKFHRIRWLTVIICQVWLKNGFSAMYSKQSQTCRHLKIDSQYILFEYVYLWFSQFMGRFTVVLFRCSNIKVDIYDTSSLVDQKYSIVLYYTKYTPSSNNRFLISHHRRSFLWLSFLSLF